jgi:hypothetical protein
VVQGRVISEDLVRLKVIVSRLFEHLRGSFALSSLYAPIPRSTFLSKLSAL